MSPELVKALEMQDDINHPSHYNAGDPLETINILEKWLSDHPTYTPFQGYLAGNIIKYLSRAGRKTGDASRDLEKARWYTNKLLESLKGE